MELTSTEALPTINDLPDLIYVVCETMNQAVSTILIPLLLVSQSLFSVPHSHAATSVNEPDGHATRPHIHLYSANHHDDHHDDHSDGDEPHGITDEHLPDHDSDAVYVGDIQFLSQARANDIVKAELSADDLVYDAVSLLVAPTTNAILRNRQPAPTTLRPRCALFLQLLSIRC